MTSNKQVPAHLRISSPPREARRCFPKSLLYEWLVLRGWRAEDTREKNSQNSERFKRCREADDDTTATTTELDEAEETRSDGASLNMNPDARFYINTRCVIPSQASSSAKGGLLSSVVEEMVG